MNLKNICTLLLIFLAGDIFAQGEAKLIREGNKHFEKGSFQEAEISYKKALDADQESLRAGFNLGDAMYEQENFTESGKKFMEISEKAEEEEIKAGSYHNLGNSLLKEKKYEQSIEAYKKALKLKPDDLDTKYNLQYAKMMLKQQQQQQQQQNKDQNKQDQKNEDQEDQQDKQKQDQQKEDQQQQEQQKDQQQQQEQEQQQQQEQEQQQEQKEEGQKKEQQQQPLKISREDAQRMLDALSNEEKETLKKLIEQRIKAQGSKAKEKDW